VRHRRETFAKDTRSPAFTGHWRQGAEDTLGRCTRCRMHDYEVQLRDLEAIA
jgi:hypothetical protein